MDRRVSLVAPYFKANDRRRQRELDECLARNIENSLIDRIILLIDDGARVPCRSGKVEVRYLTRRPTYRDWLDVIEETDLRDPVLLANSDIYFDETVGLLHDVLYDARAFVALSRWEVKGDDIYRHRNPHWSQDAWALRPENVDLGQLRTRLDFMLGVPRCDNKVAYVFATSGWAVRNPCDYIKSYHLHESELRSYDKRADARIVGGVAYVEPSETLAGDSTLHFDIWTLRTHKVAKVAVNNSLERWRLKDSAGAVRLLGSERSGTRRGKRGSRLDLFVNGKRVFSNSDGMAIYEDDRYVLAAPTRDPRRWFVLERATPFVTRGSRELFKPVVDFHVNKIRDRPIDNNDVNFWQYPCLTEKQAYANHSLVEGAQIDHRKRVIKIYVPVPWATYIDNRCYPDEVLKPLATHIRFLRALAGRLGFALEVYTVCQHIRWPCIIEHAQRIGITDLAISHCTVDAAAKLAGKGCRLRVAPWTLYAVNYQDKTRNQGLVVGKPIRERRYLASFIGAHMPHYLSDIRVRLFEELSRVKADDVVIELTNVWHFNKIVYDHQVKAKHAGPALPVDLTDSATRYNCVLSDSKFALCPEGAGPNTLRLWEAIAVGSVPVLFTRSLMFPKPLHEALNDLCLFWTDSSFGAKFVNWLRSFSDDELEERSRGLMRAYNVAERLTCFGEC